MDLTTPQPHDIAAEEALLGAILFGARIDGLTVTAEDFYSARHGDIWAACQRIADSGKRPDPTLVAGALGQESMPTLAELIGRAGVASNTPSYARTITRHADNRRLMDLALRLHQQACQDDARPGAIAEDARAALDAIDRTSGTTHRLDAVLPDLIDQIERGGTRGPSLPWRDLDGILRGFQPGRLYTIGARPGVGKSLFGQAVAWHFARRHGRDVFVSSMEMPATEYAQRFLAAESGVPLRDMDNGAMDDLRWQRISTSVSKMQGVPLWICADDTQSVRSITANAKAAARGGKLGLIVIDYLQLMQPENRKAEREQQVAQITKSLKQAAKRLSVPVVLLAQLNRQSVAGTRREPRLSDLRESGAIEQDSDVVILLDQPEQDLAEGGLISVDAIVAKNRAGRSGIKVPLVIHGPLARMLEVA